MPLEGLYSIRASGGEPTPVTTLNKDKKEDSHHSPYFLPDGRHFLFSAKDATGAYRGIYVASLDPGEPKLIIDSSMAYAEPGYILFVREKTLVAQTFDLNKLEVSGEAFQVTDTIAFNVANSRAHFSVSNTGTLVYRAEFPSQDVQLAWVDRAGKISQTVGEPGPNESIELSPDDRRFAEVRSDSSGSGTDIWVLDLERGAAATRLTLDPAGDFYPIWSHDGEQIVFCSTRNGIPNIFRKLSSGGGSDELFVRSDGVAIPMDWSRDGRYLIYMQRAAETKMDLWLLPTFGDGAPLPYLQTSYTEYSGRFSPDGRKVAYVSNESGRSEVYIRELPSSNARWQVSTTGGSQPRWRDDGNELFYVSDKNQLVSVDIKAAPTHFEVGVPKILFEIGGPKSPGYSYDAANDGQRFLIFLPEKEEAPSPFVVVKNWTDAARH